MIRNSRRKDGATPSKQAFEKRMNARRPGAGGERGSQSLSGLEKLKGHPGRGMDDSVAQGNKSPDDME